MKGVISSFVLLIFLLMIACNTNKPADEVNDAKDRVEKKVQDAREKQAEEAPQE